VVANSSEIMEIIKVHCITSQKTAVFRGFQVSPQPAQKISGTVA
jgi:hypothetical protein